MKTMIDLFYETFSPRQKRHHLSMALKEKPGEHTIRILQNGREIIRSHRRRERAGISDGYERLSKKISSERKVIKMERADFKLKEVTSRIGPASYMEVYRSTNEDAELLYKGIRVRAHDKIEDFDSLGVKFIETIDKPRLGMRVWVY